MAPVAEAAPATSAGETHIGASHMTELMQVAARFAETRTSIEKHLRESIAAFYASRSRQDGKGAAAVVADLAGYLTAFRPSDKEVSALLKDSNPLNQVTPAVKYVRENINGQPTLTPLASKAKAGSDYRQYASLWRDLADIERGDFSRKKWDSKIASDADISQMLANGITVNGHKYSSPVLALTGPDGGTPNGARLVLRAFMDVIKPRVQDLDTITVEGESEAFAQAAKQKVVVKVFNKDTNRHEPNAVAVCGSAFTLIGSIRGLCQTAVDDYHVTLTPKQVESLMDAIDSIPMVETEPVAVAAA